MTARFSIVLVLAAIVIGQACVTAAPVQDISTELSRAQAFYKARQFEEALILLTELEKRAGSDPQRATDLLTIKLYMGLAQLGLNQTEQAKARFTEVCKLDPKYTLKPEEYPANAVAVFNEVSATCAPPPRPAAPPANVSITDSTFLRGKELYEKGEFGDALKYFSVVLALDGGHGLAREYSELAQQRLALVAERGYLEWSVSFDARQFDKAAATYLRIKSDQKLGAAQLAAQIEAQYDKALSILVNAWKGACATRDFQKLDAIRNEALNIGPGLPSSRDAVAQMQPCASPATTSNSANRAVASNSPAPSRPPSSPAPPPKVASPPTRSSPPPAPKPAAAAPAPLSAKEPAAGPEPAPAGPAPVPAPAATTSVKRIPSAPTQAGECIHGDPMLAMSRLKVRVNPEIEPALQRYMGRGIIVSIAIDEKGNVTVKQVEKANPRIADALKAAVQQWKFNPTLIDNQARCVNTDLPIALIQP